MMVLQIEVDVNNWFFFSWSLSGEELVGDLKEIV
jgi:hypothetical protein